MIVTARLNSYNSDFDALNNRAYEDGCAISREEMADAISNGELASFMEAMGISTDDIRIELHP